MGALTGKVKMGRRSGLEGNLDLILNLLSHKEGQTVKPMSGLLDTWRYTTGISVGKQG